MNVFDMLDLDALPYEKRGQNVFYEVDEFKTRIIELKPGQSMPDCQMASYVLFYVVRGEVQITKGSETVALKENQVFITEPALLSMESGSGARIMGVQIKSLNPDFLAKP